MFGDKMRFWAALKDAFANLKGIFHPDFENFNEAQDEVYPVYNEEE